MKNPFVAPDIKDLVKEQVTAERHALYLLGSGVLVVVLVVSLYYLGTALGVIPRVLVTSPVPSEMEQPSIPEETTSPAQQQLDERKAIMQSMTGTTNETATLLDERRAAASEITHTQSDTAVSLDERRALMETLTSGTQ